MKSILFFFLFLTNAFAVTDEEFSRKSKQLEKLVTAFQQLCVGPDGKVLTGTVVVDKEGLMGDGNAINCSEEAKRINLIAKEVEADLHVLEKRDLECSLEDRDILDKNVKKNVKDIAKVVNKSQPQCSGQTVAQCGKDIACNVLRSSVMSTLLVVQKIAPKYKAPTCLNGSKSSCAAEFINGVIQDLFSNADAIWELAKMAGNGIKNATISGWRYLFDIEDKTSDAALAASKLKPGMFDLFKKDPVGFFKQLAITIWEDLNRAVKENFGCEKWSGAPHFSKCIAPLSTWACADCNQKMNAICGVAGALGGELLVAYLSGGTANLMAKAGSKGVQTFTKAASAISKFIPKIEKLELILKPIARGAMYVNQKVLIAGRSVVNSKTLAAIREASKVSVVKISSTAPIKISLKVLKGATSPVRGYLHLLDESFKLGMKHSNRLIGNGASTKIGHILSGESKLNDIDEVVVNINQIEEISHEVLKARLNKLNIGFEDVVLKDGSKGIRVKMTPECGTKAYLFK